MTAVEQLKDWRGTPITVGCTVVYPGRQSSSMWMNESVVRAFGSRTVYGAEEATVIVVRKFSNGYGDPPDGKPTVLTVLDRITVVPPREA